MLYSKNGRFLYTLTIISKTYSFLAKSSAMTSLFNIKYPQQRNQSTMLLGRRHQSRGETRQQAGAGRLTTFRPETERESVTRANRKPYTVVTACSTRGTYGQTFCDVATLLATTAINLNPR